MRKTGRLIAILSTLMAMPGWGQEQKTPVWEFQDLSWSPDGQQIAFTGIVDRKHRIYRIEAKPRSKPTPLFEIEGNQFCPTWSPDGRRIAFAVGQQSGHAIYVATLGAKELIKISEDGFSPAWSPDGGKIAFTLKQDGKHQICVMDPDGKNRRCLTNSPFHSFNPFWRPDGKAVVFESDRDGNDADELYQIGADGTGEAMIKRADANLVYPAYSPDGLQIAYGVVKNRNVDSYVVKASGKDEKLFKTHAGPLRWSKKGDRVAYVAYDDKKLREIFVAKPDGRDEVAITSLNHP